MGQPFPAYRGDEPLVFVCYSHEDTDVVYPEIGWLKEQGINVWYDEGISAGRVWRAEIAKAIDACSNVLYYVSESSLDSAHCNREINLALDQEKTILPVYLEDVELTDDLRVGLSRVHALHRDQDASYQQHLLNALGQSTVVGQSPVVHARKRSWRSSARSGPAVSLAVVILFCVTAIIWYLATRDSSNGPAADFLAPIRSIAVLPLENLSSDPEQGYFADGMTVTLINELTQISSLRVISRTSAMQYKNTRMPLPAIAEELNVQGVLEGSVLRRGDQVRISLKLIDARNDHSLWAESYDRDLKDVLALQEEIARSVARAVEAELTPAEEARLQGTRVIDPEAYENYLRGTMHLAQVSVPSARRAIEYFEQAIERDPEYPEAYLGLTDAYRILGKGLGALTPAEAAVKVRNATERALVLDNSLGRAHAALGDYLHDYEWRWVAAEEALLRAVELNPRDSTVNNRYGLYLADVGRFEEAIRFHQKAIDADPLNLHWRYDKALAVLFARDYESAVEQSRQILEVNPRFLFALQHIGVAYLLLGQDDDAFDATIASLRLAGRDEQWLDLFESSYRQAGIAGAFRYWLRVETDRMKTEYVDPAQLALVSGFTDDNDATLRLLERGYEVRSPLMAHVASWPPFDHLRSDPRFQDLLRRIGFPQASD